MDDFDDDSFNDVLGSMEMPTSPKKPKVQAVPAATSTDYICQRLKTLGKMYEIRVLLLQVDTPEPHNALKSLTRISLLADLTMMLAWNAEEAGKIIETYKQFEKRPPDLIMERVESNPHQKLVAALTNIKPVNKTDAVTLLQTFGNLGNVITASEERLSQVIGLGPRKAKRLFKTLQDPFLNKKYLRLFKRKSLEEHLLVQYYL
ncbi:DNA excision repair protein ERCC-1-like isoform X2 [Drosophila miranda]|uniref:DNA excision repair protein ERCC-1-like isoform X2 n=1 Tax=Drosophila miranda TaxID=7229 RepID=UPI00143F9A03|nr:DNA excision repair protein ERCC-1-like isoform X2 [Drosophila miranda]